SMVDTLKVGALIEEVDIEDLKSWIEKTNNRNIIMVYENLMKGSRNHLRAFTSQLKSYGVTYEPQVLPVDEYNEIVSSSMEAGRLGRRSLRPPVSSPGERLVPTLPLFDAKPCLGF
ncbi:MAG: DUF2202 domain-containing protein, partial [Candidatus Korarchaeota archaeon]|nr:DUF2202 domain-containing protein [Candidatus Korarchaeota archaeon]